MTDEDVILGLRADLAKAQEKAAIYEKDWREAKAEFGTATSKLREQLRASEESATRGWEIADSFHITVSGLEAEIERLRAALADIARGDYSDPFCERTPEQRARDAIAKARGK